MLTTSSATKTTSRRYTRHRVFTASVCWPSVCCTVHHSAAGFEEPGLIALGRAPENSQPCRACTECCPSRPCQLLNREWFTSSGWFGIGCVLASDIAGLGSGWLTPTGGAAVTTAPLPAPALSMAFWWHCNPQNLLHA